ncbi:MAG: Quinone oxidoreductase 1 [Elusimicrobia bacterium]|nr:Quinone oxidoreductase 1 [Elusimicrobiota bacterium]
MKAVLITRHGAPDVLTVDDLPKPEPKENEVLVKVHYASLNHLDLWIRKGSPAYPVSFPHVSGADGSGIVEKLGAGAEGVSPGDRVLIFPGISCGQCVWCEKGLDNQCETYEIMGSKRPGSLQEYVAVPDQNVIPIPDSIEFEQAAAFPLAYLMAWHLLFGRAKLTSNDTVLVSGAGSGVGMAALQIAKWKGAKVFATTTGRHKISKIKLGGAEDVFFDEKDSDYSKWIAKKTELKGADVVIDHVGPATWEKSLRSLAKYGRLVTCGATSGPVVNMDLRHLFSRNLSVLGGRMGTQREFQDLCAPIFHGEIKPVIDKIFPMEEITSAHDYFEGRQQVGKILIKIK